MPQNAFHSIITNIITQDFVKNIRGLVKINWSFDVEQDNACILNLQIAAFTKAPINDRRWRLPEPIIWDGVLEAFRCGSDCPQFDPLSRYTHYVL